MALQLDDRQRAMLLEMGVRVWLPGTSFEAAPAAVPVRSEPESRGRVAPVQGAVPQQAAAVPRAQTLSPVPPGSGWDALVQASASCQACGLCAGRKQSTLCSVGAPAQADWMVVGDPPDEDEDRSGRAFTGQAGLLLDNMLKAVGASRTGAGRQGAYATNVVKCRPPTGRLPQTDELVQCAGYLQGEIERVQPKVILAMGRFAIELLLSGHPDQVALPLGKQRGRVYRYAGIPVVVTYHPQVLLRARADKGKAWADLCLAVQLLQDGDPSLQSGT